MIKKGARGWFLKGSIPQNKMQIFGFDPFQRNFWSKDSCEVVF